MVALGVDPGIANTGISVICRSISKYELLESELVKSDAKELKAERLLAIHNAVSRLIEAYDPGLVSVEKCYHNRNISSSQSTGAVIGVVMVAAAAKGIPVVEVSPQEVKRASGLGGKADKKAVVRGMSRLLRQQTLNNHIADACAVAIAGTVSRESL